VGVASVVRWYIERRSIGFILGDYRILAISRTREVSFQIVSPASLYDLELFRDRGLVTKKDETSVALIRRRLGAVLRLPNFKFGAVRDTSTKDAMTF